MAPEQSGFLSEPEPNTIYDAAIVGGGHNGLVCAAYLARAGLKVIVLERRPVLGGACVTESLNGCRVSRAAYVCSLFPPKIINDLGLKEEGLELLERNPPSFTPFKDGRYLILHNNLADSQKEIAKFSLRDAFQYERYENDLDRVAKFVEPLLLQTPPDQTRKRDWPKLLKLGWRLLKLDRRELTTLSGLFGLSAYDFVRQYFESDILISTLCTDGIIGSVGGPMNPGTAYILLHHVMGGVNGHRGRWGYIRGGMGGLTAALQQSGLKFDVQYLVNAEVVKIGGGRRCRFEVVLADGAKINTRVVVSSADLRQTFQKIAVPTYRSVEFYQGIKSIDYSSATAKINLVVAGDLRFKCYPEAVPGTFHICEDVNYMERSADAAKYGQIPEELIIEGCNPSVVDDTLSPAGKQVISLLVQYIPYQLEFGDWNSRRSELLTRTINKLAEYTNIGDLGIEAADILTPPDLEREFCLTGGNLFHGAMNPSRLFSFRPVLGFADYRTPLEGMYLCGSATHPGGGVTGIPGHNAAREILKDKRW